MSVTLQKARRILRSRGFSALVGRGARQAAGLLEAVFRTRGDAHFEDAAGLLDFASTTCRGIFAPFQVRSEILALLGLLRERRPRTIVEIGTANGGTLLLFTRVAAADALLVSVDLPGGAFGDGYAIWRVPVYRSFAVEQQKVRLLRADSHAASTRRRVGALLGGRPVDLLFIDGDHTYDGVKADFASYSDLVARGGLVVLHDIAPHPGDADVGVDRFWREVRGQYDVREFVADPPQGWGGIGVLEMP